MYNRPVNGYDRFSGYKEPSRPQTASVGFGSPSPYGSSMATSQPPYQSYVSPPAVSDYGSTVLGTTASSAGVLGTAGPASVCLMHRQDLVSYCVNCNGFVCEVCKQQRCRRDHEYLPPQAIEAQLIKETEQNLSEISGELAKRQTLDKQLFEISWDPAGWNVRAMNEIKALESRLREVLLQRQNELASNVQRVFERRTEIVQNVRRDISNMVLCKGVAETLTKKIRSTTGLQTIGKLKGYKDELEGLKQTKAGIMAGSTAPVATACQQYAKMVSGEWKADAILELYFQEGAAQSQIAQMIAGANGVLERVTALQTKQKELDAVREQERALAAGISEAAVQFKSLGGALDEKMRSHPQLATGSRGFGADEYQTGTTSGFAASRPYYPPAAAAAIENTSPPSFGPQSYATPTRLVTMPADPPIMAYSAPRQEFGQSYAAGPASGGIPAMYRPFVAGAQVVSPKYTTMAPAMPTMGNGMGGFMKTVQCCKKSVDPAAYLSDLDRHNRGIMNTRPGEVYQEQFYCPYCERTIYRSDLLAWEFPADQVDRVVSSYPSRKNDVPCAKCGKMILPDDKIAPCEHTFHKKCLLDYLESASGSNFQCEKCGKYLQEAYQSLMKERSAKTRSCCICSSPQAVPYQTLSCGHYFCKDCFSKYYMSGVYFDYSDRGSRVRCQHCNSMVMLIKARLDCGCTYELESLRQKLLSGMSWSAGSALNLFCPNCKNKPIYSEEGALIFGYAQYQEMAKAGRGPSSSLQKIQSASGAKSARSMGPSSAITYQKESCTKCGVKADGLENYRCPHVFYCRPCIKSYLNSP